MHDSPLLGSTKWNSDGIAWALDYAFGLTSDMDSEVLSTSLHNWKIADKFHKFIPRFGQLLFVQRQPKIKKRRVFLVNPCPATTIIK